MRQFLLKSLLSILLAFTLFAGVMIYQAHSGSIKVAHASTSLICTPAGTSNTCTWVSGGLGNPINGWWYSNNGFGCCNTAYGQGGPENWQYGTTGSWQDRLQWQSPNLASLGEGAYIWDNATVWIWVGSEDATSCAMGWVQDITGTQTTFWVPQQQTTGWWPIPGVYNTNQNGTGVFVSLTNKINPNGCGGGNGGNLVAGSAIMVTEDGFVPGG